ncbi:MAG TPA: hypothetical protein VFJ51_03395 [Nitrososphaeraceae archaeon]|nr:hypothetical protein [Nitrososphaeraceae archaeon]
MSLSSVNVVCRKCGSTLFAMRTLKSIRDTLRPSHSRCTVCGTMLNPGDFTVSVERWNNNI